MQKSIRYDNNAALKVRGFEPRDFYKLEFNKKSVQSFLIFLLLLSRYILVLTNAYVLPQSFS